MISELLSTTTGRPPPHDLRLAVKSESARGGVVDGAWWPWSTDPTTEFPPLITAMGAQDAIRRVSYHLRSWQPTTRRIAVGGLDVRLEGFNSTQPDTVNLIRSDHTRIRLLVIPPDTPGGVARAVLRAASTADQTTTVEEILAGNGLSAGQDRVHPVTALRARPPALDEEDRWETGNGAPSRMPVAGVA